MTTSMLMSKIIDIGLARRRLEKTDSSSLTVTSRDEKRSARRVPAAERLFLQIVESDDQDLVGTTLSCETMDISATGIRLRTSQFIPEGCQLDLWVDNPAGPGKFFLVSDVRWVAPSRGIFNAEEYQVGLQLQECATTDIASWREAYQ